jgi:hypothetical protein
MSRDVEMQNAAAVVREDDEDEQDSKGECRHREEIDRDGGVEVV